MTWLTSNKEGDIKQVFDIFQTMCVELSAVTKDNVDDVKIILSSVLPVAYPPSFYKRLGKQRWLSWCFQMSLLSVEEKLSGYLAKKAEKTVGCIIWETLEDNSLHLLALGKNLLTVGQF